MEKPTMLFTDCEACGGTIAYNPAVRKQNRIIVDQLPHWKGQKIGGAGARPKRHYECSRQELFNEMLDSHNKFESGAIVNGMRKNSDESISIYI